MLYFILAIIGGYFAVRYLSILYAFREITKDIREILKDLTQNQILHLPIPNRDLEKVLCSFNDTLEEIRKERLKYEKREKEFQKQIENISHDLRTPLTVILGYLKLMKKADKKLNMDKELAEALEIIEHKAETMKILVTQFYDFSRLNAGDYDPIWVIGDDSAIERIFLNLLQNASRYAYSFLSISIKEEEEKVTISFINDTNMLSEDDIPHLFDRFYMHDSSRNEGGTGLGLTVAKSLAEEMGGILEVSIVDKELLNSEKDKFTICFELCVKATKK
ncbi:MAG: histidine kinase [Clostridiaceae bacterium]|nr:histidine kinase [Clostridiaceae bacterium]